MNLNRFLKSDRERAERLIKSMDFLITELLPDAIEDGDYEGCIEIAGSMIAHCKDLKRMEHPEQVVQLHEIASKLLSKGIDVSTIRRAYQ
ncbi:YqaH family protein [Bacillus changyiensis]|uniref:YqaH family protein n=1 Tax=Bacillus changyiensis TaxID=3004103 RepID=UPI0022E19B3C|nr:YqaH family protein [Bacillus changyiensis]MDA1478112.1 hypothetical protein [Bacillus changyiensis]